MTNIVAGIIISLIIIVALIYYNTPQTTSNQPQPNSPNSTPVDAGTTLILGGQKAPSNIGKTGVWFRVAPGGSTYVNSKAHCGFRGGRLATKEEVEKAGAAGLTTCKSGWLEGPEQGWYSDGVDVNCGPLGWNTLPNATTSSRLSAFCYGVIPRDSDVAKSVII